MSKFTFKVEKISYYQDNKKESEHYTVFMDNKLIFNGYRSHIEELVKQLVLALNDRKEDKDE